MTTTYGSPFANPASTPQPNTLSQFPTGVSIPVNMSTLTPGMAAIQAYRARGGAPVGGRTLGGVAGALGAQGGGATGMLGAAQGAAADRSPMPSVQPQPSPYASAMQSMGGLRPPTGYQSSNAGPVQTMMGGPTSLGYSVQGPANAGGVRVGRIRPPNFRAMNTRY